MHACALTFQMFGILIKLSLRYKNVCVIDPTGKKLIVLLNSPVTVLY